MNSNHRRHPGVGTFKTRFCVGVSYSHAAYDPLDRLKQDTPTGVGTTHAFDYDPNGNLVTRTRGTTQRLFVWNARDRLVEVKEASLTLGKYKYNAKGFRDEIEGKRRTTWVNGFAYLDKDPETFGVVFVFA